MFKKEIIWREILFQAIEKKKKRFTQKDLAVKFGFSLSTVFNALKVPRATGALNVTGRFFEVVDKEKFLIIWGTFRNLNKEIIYKTHVDFGVSEIENEMPPDIVYGVYTAYKKRFKDVPADYDKVYIYAGNLTEIKKRFPLKKGYENLIVLMADKFLKEHGLLTTIGQTYADLWNLPEWYAKDFLDALKDQI